MKHLSIIAALYLAACAPPPPICDRDAIEWDKWGEPAQLPPECLPSRVAPVITHVDGKGTSDPDAHPEAPVTPPQPDAPDESERNRWNNGLGNGDQSAPGNSGPNNGAENETGAPGHASGKLQGVN